MFVYFGVEDGEVGVDVLYFVFGQGGDDVDFGRSVYFFSFLFVEYFGVVEVFGYICVNCVLVMQKMLQIVKLVLIVFRMR